MKKIIPILSVMMLWVLAPASGQQTADPETYASTIQEEDFKDLLGIIASDAMEGRETGERGQKMAAAFIREHFKSLGLQPPVTVNGQKSYFQPIKLYAAVPAETYLTVNGQKVNNFEGMIHVGSGAESEINDMEVVFGGNGSEAALTGLDAEGKALLVWVNGRREQQAVIERAGKLKPSVMLMVPADTDVDYDQLQGRYKNYLMSGRLRLEKPEASGDGDDSFLIPPSLAASILGKDLEKVKSAVESGKLKGFKPGKISYKTSTAIREVDTENVLGYLEGTDKKDELIVITAHYDHIGRNGEEINNGADDDGSGTTSILELAEAFARAKKDGNGPRRSILFMTVTGEEKGLLGSAYYAANPVFPLENTVADLNIDMIGRIDPKHEADGKYVYLVGSNRLSTELHEISESVNDTFTKLELDYTYNDENHPDRIYYRSDHWNFAKNNIPVIFYFSGIHEDYHRPTDTVEKINYDLLTIRARLVFHTAWALANRDERIEVDVTSAE